ncbi:MAG TPA: L,D-transpeptidase [Myxococcota bacterium]|nr:L,D-transpeptidase [Myxococcota bacterium]
MKSRVHLLGASLLLAALLGAAVPFWGAKESLPVGTDPASLKPGQFVWEGDAVPAGPLAVVVSLEEQRAFVYRNGIRIGVTTVSSGKPGHRTPTGVFTILQKDANHHSKKYNDAPMPFSERLTWDGVALHAGGLPGYPSSHGCVHLPSEFARLLFQVSKMGMVVVIADQHSPDLHLRHPTELAPIDAASGADDVLPRLGPDEAQRWTPDASPTGPVAVLVSGADQRVIVFRNGVEIGRAKIAVRDPQQPLGTHAFVLLDESAARPAAAAGAVAPRWVAVGVPGDEAEKGRVLDPARVARVSMPESFRTALRGVLTPGATLLVTDAAVLPQTTTGVPLTVVTADPPPEAGKAGSEG